MTATSWRPSPRSRSNDRAAEHSLSAIDPQPAFLSRSVPHHAVIIEVEVRELPVTGLQIEFDVSLGLCRAAADLGDLVFKAMRQVNSCPVFGSRNRVLDGLTTGLN